MARRRTSQTPAPETPAAPKTPEVAFKDMTPEQRVDHLKAGIASAKDGVKSAKSALAEAKKAHTDAKKAVKVDDDESILASARAEQAVKEAEKAIPKAEKAVKTAEKKLTDENAKQNGHLIQTISNISPIYLFNFFMNRTYAFFRDNGRMTPCRRGLKPRLQRGLRKS